MTRTFRNPVLPGFYPDPSVCCVGEDYYLVTSTFEYFPGVPVFHSRDLIHWRQIGYALSRPSQLNLDAVPPSYGIFAATIRHHDGLFYVITTWADVNRKLHNFIVTSSDPAGEWSEPYFLNDAPGIDPSLYFEHGRAWYTGNRTPAGQDHRDTPRREIWMQELDLTTMQLTGEKYVLWNGMSQGEAVPEAPHIYKMGEYYYLLVAEGGTYFTHCVTIARSKTLTGAYEGCDRNPVLTHRHLGYDYPISNVGHGDLIETQNGEWWMVLLGSRPYDGYFYNLGRETFLVPVRWDQEGWLVVSPGSGRVEFEYPAPDLPQQPWASTPACDHFDAPDLALCWNFLRTPRDQFWYLSDRSGWLRLALRPQQLSENANPSAILRRQQHRCFAARTLMQFSPRAPHECAGIVLLQNKDFHFRFVCAQNAAGSTVIQLIRRAEGQDELLGEHPLADFDGWLYLKVEARGRAYSFYYATAAEAWLPCIENVDARILSTTVAGGFVGTMLGIYASSQGQPSDNLADFDWFEYAQIDNP